MRWTAGCRTLSNPPIKPGHPDLPTDTYFAYGYREGIPRLLDRHAIKMSCFMIGSYAVDHKQYLAVAAGLDSDIWKTQGTASIMVVFSL